MIANVTQMTIMSMIPLGRFFCSGSVIVLLLIASTSAEAADWWFRPAGQTYGAGDGTSYKHAYAGIDTAPDSSTTSTRIAPGDTVYICGHHRGMLVVLKDNLTIDLACSAHNDPGTIDGTDIDTGSGWQLNSKGEYQKTFSSAPKLIVRDGELMTPALPGSLSQGEWGCVPQWFTPVCDNSTGPWTVYVKDNPAGHTMEIGARNIGIQLGVAPVRGQGIRSLTVRGGGVGKIIYQGGTTWGWGKGISAWSDGWAASDVAGGTWTIDGVTFIGQQSQGIHTYGTGTTGSAPSQLSITNNRFYDTGAEALYLKGGRQVLSALIENNIIGSSSHMQHGWDAQPNCSAATGDGIDMGGGPTDVISHAIVRGNIITNSRGNGIAVSGADSVIAGNTVSNANFKNAPCPHAGIALSPQVPGSIRVHSNRVSSTYGHALSLDGLQKSSNTVDIDNNVFDSRTAVGHAGEIYIPSWWPPVRFVNNTLMGGQYGLNLRFTHVPSSSFEIRNNIFEGIAYPIFQISNHPKTHATNNIFHGFVGFLVRNTRYNMVTTMESGNSTFTNNLHVDPLLSAGYKPSPNSPAIDRGRWDELSEQDYAGKHRIVGHIDIGAIQTQ
ncbi:MAG: right-handed parallel beta-helix repeat-containing protein [Nitrospirota bacterium]